MRCAGGGTTSGAPEACSTSPIPGPQPVLVLHGTGVFGTAEPDRTRAGRTGRGVPAQRAADPARAVVDDHQGRATVLPPEAGRRLRPTGPNHRMGGIDRRRTRLRRGGGTNPFTETPCPPSSVPAVAALDGSR